MTVLSTFSNGGSLKDFRDTYNAMLADIAALKGSVGTPTPAPTLSLSSAVTQAEGNSGSTAFAYTLTLTRNGSTASFPFSWAVTGNGGNPADPADFGGVFPSGSGTFAQGETSKTISVPVSGDTAVEPAEGFLLTINASGLNSVSSTGMISNDDTAYVFSRELMVVGDSQTQNAANPAHTAAADYPAWNTIVLGQGGRGMGTDADIGTSANTVYGALNDMLAAKARLYVIHDGANTLADGITAQQWLDHSLDIADRLHAGTPGCAVFWCTPLPRADATAISAGFEAKRQAINTGLRSAIGGRIDGIVPYGQHPLLGDANDATYFQSDKLHITAAGYAQMKPVFDAVVRSFLNGATATTPSAFTFTDLNNLEPTTAYTSELVYVSGLGAGKSVTATVAGGTMQARQAAFGTSAVTGMVNGDAARVRATTASTSVTATDVTLALGSRSDIFTLTTKAAQASQVSLATVATTFTESHDFFTSRAYSVSMPAGRPLLMLEVNASGSPTFSVKIDGVAAPIVSPIVDRRFIVLAAADLAAGAHSVEVTCSNAFNSVAIRAATLTNANAANPVTGSASLSFQFRADEDHAVDQAITIPTGGLAAMAYYNADRNFALTTGYTLARDYGDGWYWITTTASGTYHIKSNGYTNTAMLAVGIRP